MFHGVGSKLQVMDGREKGTLIDALLLEFVRAYELMNLWT